MRLAKHFMGQANASRYRYGIILEAWVDHEIRDVRTCKILAIPERA